MLLGLNLVPFRIRANGIAPKNETFYLSLFLSFFFSRLSFEPEMELKTKRKPDVLLKILTLISFRFTASILWTLTSDSSIAHYVDTVYRCLSFTSKSTPSSPGTSSASRSTRSLHGRTKCFTSSSRWSWCTRYLSASSSSRTAQSFTRSHSAVDKRRVRSTWKWRVELE